MKSMKKFKCPFCLHEFTKEEAIKVNRNGMTLYKCPNETKDSEDRPLCGKTLPLRFFESESKVISLVGGVGVGKTYFFMAMKRILERGAINELGITGNMFFGDEESENYFNQILFECDNGKIDATQKDAGVEKRALGLEIHIEQKGLIKTNKIIYLSFFDNPGEGFSNPIYIVENMNLHKSDAVIFLISPEQLENYADLTKSQCEGLVSPSSIADVINNITNVFLSITPKSSLRFLNRKIKVPFAFCISKSDNLKESFSIQLPDDLSDHDFFANNKFRNKLISNENEIIVKIDSLSNMIESIIYANNNNTYLKQRIQANFSNYRYFGVESIRFENNEPGLAPRGVALPLIWVLYNINQL
jgi:hypothetical protein